MRINNQTYINTCSLSVIEFIVKKIHNYSINAEQKNYIISLLNDEGLSINNLESILSSYSLESETFYVNKIKKTDFYNNQIFILPVKKQDYWHYLVVHFFNEYFYVFDSSNNSKKKLDDISEIYSNIIITVKKSSNIILSNLKTLKINKVSLDINLKYISIVLFITIISSFFSILFYLRIQVYISSISYSFHIMKITSYFFLFICIEIFIHFCSFLNELILKKIRSNNIKIINNIYSKKISKISVKTYEDNKNIIKDFLDNSHSFIDYFFKSRIDLLVLLSNCIIFIFISFSLGHLISITFLFFVLLEIFINYYFSKYLKNSSINEFYKSSFKSLLFSIFLFTILFLLSNIDKNNEYLKYSNFFYSFFIYNIISFKISNYFSKNSVIFKKDELDHIYNKFSSLSEKSYVIEHYDTTVIYENNIINYKTVNKISNFDINKLVFINEKSIDYEDLNYSNLKVFHATENLYSNIEFNVSDYDKNILFKNEYRINYDEPGFLERILISVISLINSKNNCIIFMDNSILSTELTDFLINKIKNKGRIYFYEKV